VRVVVGTPPDAYVTASDAKAWAPVLAADGDARVQHLLRVAQAGIEPPAGWMGRAFGRQTLRVVTRVQGSEGIALPIPPFVDVTGVSYRDRAGAPQTIAEDGYRILDRYSNAPRLLPLAGQRWPDAIEEDDAFEVTYRAGLEANDPLLLPAKQAIVLAAIDLQSLGSRELALRSEEVPGIGTVAYTVSESAGRIIRDTADRLLAASYERIYA